MDKETPKIEDEIIRVQIRLRVVVYLTIYAIQSKIGEIMKDFVFKGTDEELF